MAKNFDGANFAPVYETIATATAETPAKAPKQSSSKEKQPRINMAFTPANYEYIQTMAKATGRNMTDFVNAIIEKHAAEHAEQYARVKDFKAEI